MCGGDCSSSKGDISDAQITINSNSNSNITQGDGVNYGVVKADIINLKAKNIVQKAKNTTIAKKININANNYNIETDAFILSDELSEDNLLININGFDETTQVAFKNNGQIISQNNLTIITQNNLDNEGIISAQNDLTLESLFGDVNNSSYKRRVSNFIATILDEEDSSSKFIDYLNEEEAIEETEGEETTSEVTTSEETKSPLATSQAATLIEELKQDPNKTLTNEESDLLLDKLRGFLIKDNKEYIGSNSLYDKSSL